MKVKVEDGGDGSTYVTITLDSGVGVLVNPDVPHDGYYEAEFDAEGTIVREHTEYA